MTTLKEFEQEGEKEFNQKFFGQYDIINDGVNEPYITGVTDKGLYSVDGLMDIILDWHNKRTQKAYELGKQEAIAKYKSELKSYGYGGILEKFNMEKAQNKVAIQKAINLIKQ